MHAIVRIIKFINILSVLQMFWLIERCSLPPMPRPQPSYATLHVCLLCDDSTFRLWIIISMDSRNWALDNAELNLMQTMEQQFHSCIQFWFFVSLCIFISILSFRIVCVFFFDFMYACRVPPNRVYIFSTSFFPPDMRVYARDLPCTYHQHHDYEFDKCATINFFNLNILFRKHMKFVYDGCMCGCVVHFKSIFSLECFRISCGFNWTNGFPQ